MKEGVEEKKNQNMGHKIILILGETMRDQEK
jgi:hypothetical protein